MASPHLSAQFITRGSGHSAVEASAYRARAELHDERTGITHDYTRARSKCIFEGIYAPKDAPEWAHDRAKLWNHVEAFEKHRRAELAQEVNIALPHELTLEQNRWLLQDWVKENATRKGLIADVAIHEPDGRGDARNIHAHVMIVRRKLDESEFVRTKERFEKFSEKQAAKEADLCAMRASWEKLANKHLERHGHEARIDMGRKLDGVATLHLGKHATRMERRGEASELGEHNRTITAENVRRQAANQNTQAEGFTTTLDAIRQREAKRVRGTAAETTHALDDLARTDPLGAARHFGHQLGDRPKSPADVRRAMVAVLRQIEEPSTPQPVRERSARDPDTTNRAAAPQPDPGRDRATWTAQAEGFAGLSAEHQCSARQSFEAWRDKRAPADTRPGFTLPEYVDYVQQREARKREPKPAQPTPEAARPTPKTARPAAEPARPQPKPQQRDQVTAKPAHMIARPAWTTAAGLGVQPPARVTVTLTMRGVAEQAPQKPARGPEPVRGPILPGERPRLSAAPQERPGASYLRAALSSTRERLNSLGARLGTVCAAIMARGSSRAHDGHVSGGRAQEDTSSRKVNTDAAAEQRAAEREAKAREAAASRETARLHDRQQHTHAKGEERRVRPSIWEEDIRRAELEAAAEQLRRALERPGEHDHSRERKP